MSDVFSYLQLSSFTEEEEQMVARLRAMLDRFEQTNLLKEAYYEGKQRVQNMGIAIPPQLKAIETVVGWPGIAVDVLDERLDLEGFAWRDRPAGDDLGIGDIFQANQLNVESGPGNLEALIYGVAFIAVGTGFDGEPSPLITVESPKNMVATYDRRARQVDAALSRIHDPVRGIDVGLTLYLPGQTITASKTAGQWQVDNRDMHNLGRVTVARLVNRPRSGDPFGRSEISRAVRSLTNNAVRTVLEMEVAREFYSAPQRYILGANESAFQDAKGNPKPAWEAYIGRYLALEALDDPNDPNGRPMLPQVGQFPAGSMGPYSEQIRTLSQLFAAETAIPSSYLGFVTENPASADSIRAMASRLEKRAERRITGFGGGWADAGNLAMLVRDGEPGPPGLFTIWGDPATPTKSAQADATIKFVQSGMLQARSEITYEQAGFDAATRARLLAEDQAVQTNPASRLAAALQAVQANAPTPP